jgi:hypothetical protein
MSKATKKQVLVVLGSPRKNGGSASLAKARGLGTKLVEGA